MSIFSCSVPAAVPALGEQVDPTLPAQLLDLVEDRTEDVGLVIEMRALTKSVKPLVP